MEFRCGSRKMMFVKKYKIISFCEENSKNISKKMVKFRSWKT